MINFIKRIFCTFLDNKSTYKNVHIIKNTFHSILTRFNDKEFLLKSAVRALVEYTINANNPMANDGNNFVYAKRFEKFVGVLIKATWLGYEQKTDLLIKEINKTIEVKLGTDIGEGKNNADIQYSHDVPIDNSKKSKDPSDLYLFVRAFSNDDTSIIRFYLCTKEIWKDISNKKNGRSQRTFTINRDTVKKSYCIFHAFVTLPPLKKNAQIKKTIKSMNQKKDRVQEKYFEKISEFYA